MSILIRGMRMPKNCAECPVALSGKYCRINQTYTTYIKLSVRPDHCPLVELPEKHGRLFDADEVKKCIEGVADSDDKTMAIALLEWAYDNRRSNQKAEGKSRVHETRNLWN